MGERLREESETDARCFREDEIDANARKETIDEVNGDNE